MKYKQFLMLGMALVAGAVFAQQGDSAQPQRLRVSQGGMAGLLLHKVEPKYPEAAKKFALIGTVILRLQIDKHGNVAQVDIVSGHPLFLKAAIDAVKQWQFKPYLLNGDPVDVETTATFQFAPDQPLDPSKLRVAEGMTYGNLVYQVKPVYPPEAKAKHIQGEVVLQASIDREGKIADVKPLQGDPLLAEAAMKAVKQWKYTPYFLNGQPEKIQTTIKIQFHL